MESVRPLPRVVTHIALSAIFAVFVGWVVYQVSARNRMQPTLRMEGFFAGPPRGAGIPDCTNTQQEFAKLMELFVGKQSTVGEGSDDFQELRVLTGKLACLKRDLMGAAHLVNATRGQPFRTSHDMEPVAETAARIFAKTMPKRDLDLAFDKWNKRGTLLLKRLCTAYKFSEEERKTAVDLFNAGIKDIAGVAYDVCAKGDPTIAGDKAMRTLQGMEPAGLNMHMEYKGYY
jgi:hypothetical protein